MYYSAYGGICQAIFPKNGDSLSEKTRKRLYTLRGIVYNSRKALRCEKKGGTLPNMKCVLCISAPGRVADFLRSVFEQGIADRFIEASTPEQAWEALETGAFDYILVNSPFAGGDGCRLAVEAAERQPEASVLLFVREEWLEKTAPQVEEQGVFVITKPINKSGFFDALRLVAAARKRLFGLTDENLRLRARIEELRLIDRAKCTLISVLNISEKEAHRTIEKQAMDLRLTKKQVAEHILRTYDNE